MKELNITAQDSTKTIELIQRTAGDIPYHKKESISIVGDIYAPFRFLDTYKDLADFSYVTIDADKRELVLVNTNGTDEVKHVVRGRLLISQDLENFSINTQEQRGIKELRQFLKMNRMFFASSSEFVELYNNLESFNAKISTQIEQNDDDKGNIVNNYSQQLEIAKGFNLSFTLRMPVFKNTDPVDFQVDINFNVRTGGVFIWLESVELKDYLYSKGNEMLYRQEDNFITAGVTVLNI